MVEIPKYERKKYIEEAKENGWDGEFCIYCEDFIEAKGWTLIGSDAGVYFLVDGVRVTRCDCQNQCLCETQCNDCMIQSYKKAFAKENGD